MEPVKQMAGPRDDDEALRAAGIVRSGGGSSSAGAMPLDHRIRGMLAGFRWRIRLYVWLQGLALALAWIGLAFWVTLALDYYIEPPALVRQILIGIAGAGLAYVLWRYVLRRLVKPIADADLALLLERRFKSFRDSLVTTVELAEHPDHAAQFNSQMLAYTQSQAMRELPGARLGAVFNRGPLLRGVAAAAIGVGTVVAFAVLATGAMNVWAQRNLLFRDDPWPRRTHLTLVGFKDKRIKVAKGADVKIVVHADTTGDVPDSVQLRYKTDEGRSRENMSKVGLAEAGDEFQEFAFTFRGILTSRTFDVVGGDAVLRGYQIDVVDVPTIEMSLHFEYPKYTRREAADRRVTGSMDAPQGTTVTVNAKANKNLVEAPVAALVGDKTQPLDTIKLDGQSDRRHFSYKIDHLDEDRTLLFTLHDEDGISSREPIRLILRATPDEPPRVGVRLRGISSSITPQARLPIDGEVTDDYGVVRQWYSYKLDDTDAVEVPLKTDSRGRTSVKYDRAADEALEMKERGLKVGRQVTVEIGAEDNCALSSGPNRAVSERFQLAVVQPEQLMTLLEARELQLRIRLESIIQDLSSTREQLAAAKFTAPKAGGKPPAKTSFTRRRLSADFVDSAAPNEPPAGKLAPGDEPDDVKTNRPAGAEPGDSSDQGPGLHSPQVLTEQALAYSERGASETTALADAFDDIRDEMNNNGIATTKIEYRLKQEIADPLRQIGAASFADLDRRLRRLQSSLADPQAAKTQHAEALKQIDVILDEMRSVLGHMLALETFNQILENLRDVIDQQDALNKQTQKVQKVRALNSGE